MTGRRVVDGAWTDDVTDAAWTAAAAGRRPDHDAGIRQARTAMTATRTSDPWTSLDYLPRWLTGRAAHPDAAATSRWVRADGDADAELVAMPRPDRDRIEALARATSRTYRDVARRRQQLRALARNLRALAGADPR